ncbi:unnamed protein product [Porites evermanni]|uniref:Maturase K n=1 Tax=Porites evermanni TaxID=104178 RepID=A0ABN8LWN9_9CNID|nr:unnamed protein product [Porites evermanni]
MLRFRKLINKETLLKLYKAFILPHFYYFSSVWHFCGARNANKSVLYELSRLFKRYVHRTIFILQFARKSYPGPSQPKNKDLQSAPFFILS